jgi:dCTP deaminase
MILSKRQVEEAITNKELIFEPALDAFQIQPAAMDLRIGWSFYIPYTWKYNERGRVAVTADYVDYSTASENFQLLKLKPGQYFEILPGEMIIASTLEKITINNGKIVGMLHPRSSSSRRGLSIESGVIHPFYSGHLMIALRNDSHHVIKIYPGERLCQVIFQEISGVLTVEEAAKHGLHEAKYQSATPYNLGIKPDSQEELDLLRGGKIEEIKANFSQSKA